jgi:hypothetical protein
METIIYVALALFAGYWLGVITFALLVAAKGRGPFDEER